MLLDEIKENVLSNGIDKVDINQLVKYHELVYNEGVKVSCNSCIIEAYIRLRNYYRKNIDGDEYKRLYYLKVALIQFEKEQKFELCEFIKSRL